MRHDYNEMRLATQENTSEFAESSYVPVICGDAMDFNAVIDCNAIGFDKRCAQSVESLDTVKRYAGPTLT